MSGWGLTFEMFQETSIRGDTFADAVDGGLAFLAFFDGHTAVASPAALAHADVTGRETFPDYSVVVVTDAARRPDRRTARGRGDGTGPARDSEAHRRGQVPLVRRGDAEVECRRPDRRPRHGRPRETFELLREMEARGDLSVRMIVPLWQHPEFSFDQMRAQLSCRDERGGLWRGGVAKFFIDGVIESGTGSLIEPDTKGMGTSRSGPNPRSTRRRSGSSPTPG